MLRHIVASVSCLLTGVSAASAMDYSLTLLPDNTYISKVSGEGRAGVRWQVRRGEAKAFVWEDGLLTQMRATNKGDAAWVSGVTDNGYAVGGSTTKPSAGSLMVNPIMVAWTEGGTPFRIPRLPSSAARGIIAAVSDNGMAVFVPGSGYRLSSTRPDMAPVVSWRIGTTTLVTAPKAPVPTGHFGLGMIPADINNAGVIVANRMTYDPVARQHHRDGYVLRPGQDWESLGAETLYVEAISNTGWIAGWNEDGTGFVIEPDGTRHIIPVDSGTTSAMIAINDDGAALGLSGWMGAGPFIWRGGVRTQLPRSYPANDGKSFWLTTVRSIDNAGRVYGDGHVATERVSYWDLFFNPPTSNAFVLTPATASASLAGDG
jgi:hypothetical protein